MDQLGLASVRRDVQGGHGQIPARAEHDWAREMGWESGQEPEPGPELTETREE